MGPVITWHCVYIVGVCLLCLSFASNFSQKRLRTTLYCFCTYKNLVLSGASAASTQAGTMLGIPSNWQVFFAAHAIAQIALGTVLSLLLNASWPDHPSLEFMNQIWTELGDKGCITKK